MKIRDIVGDEVCFHGLTYKGYVWPEVQERIEALLVVGGIDPDLFFPVIETGNYGIERKLNALSLVCGGSDAPRKFAVRGNHQNTAARATERALCKAWKHGRALAKAAKGIEAMERADARRTLAQSQHEDPFVRVSLAKRLEGYKASLRVWRDKRHAWSNGAWNGWTETTRVSWMVWCGGSNMRTMEQCREDVALLFRKAGKHR